MMRVHLALFLLLICCGCTHDHLNVRNETVDYHYLASTHVNTPDPLREQMYQGQQLIVGWDIPRKYLHKDNLHLLMTIRFRNNEQQKITVPMQRAWGTYVFRLLNEDYIQKEGIMTYKVEIYGNGKVLDTWTHQLWAELIDFPI